MKLQEKYHLDRTVSSKVVVGWVWLLAILLLVSAGITHRVLASRLKIITETPIALPAPLSAFPMQFSGWFGKDIPISDTVQKAAGNDDYLNRLYVNKSNNQWSNVYIAYSAHPRTMLGHRPELCYVGGGWVHDSTETSEFVSLFGRRVQCLIHRFHMPSPRTDEVVVLNYYILNGRMTINERGFSGIGMRTPNIAGNIARYVVQVQISSRFEHVVRAVAEDIAEVILEYVPDENGNVKAEARDLRSEIKKRR